MTGFSMLISLSTMAYHCFASSPSPIICIKVINVELLPLRHFFPAHQGHHHSALQCHILQLFGQCICTWTHTHHTHTHMTRTHAHTHTHTRHAHTHTHSQTKCHLQRCSSRLHSGLLHYLIREIKIWLNINPITAHNNTYQHSQTMTLMLLKNNKSPKTVWDELDMSDFHLS